MTDKVLVDASFLVAQLDERDVHHQAARALHEAFRAREAAYIYLDFVVNETVTVLARRARERKLEIKPIIRRVRSELPVGQLAWAGSEVSRLWERALDALEEYQGRLSLNDCLLTLIAQEGGVRWVASFDKGFDQVPSITRIGKAADFHT
jgi:predicted nucleic acid-binding protein